MNSARLFVGEPKMADFADDVAFAVGQWVLPGRQNSVRRGRKPREKSKIDQTLRSGSFEFDLCQKSRGSSPKRTNSIPASPFGLGFFSGFEVLETQKLAAKDRDPMGFAP